MIEIVLPAMGEGIIEAEITRWLVKEGMPVELDEPVVEVATDKVDSEIPSPGKGVIQKIMFREGDTAKIGQVLAIIAGEGEKDTSQPKVSEAEYTESPLEILESGETKQKEPRQKEPVKQEVKKESGGSNTVVWVGLGVVAVGSGVAAFLLLRNKDKKEEEPDDKTGSVRVSW